MMTTNDATAIGRAWLDDVRLTFRKQKKLADDALAQVGDEEFFRTIDPESNSLALIVKHVAGNQRSRWRDFLTSDGEKADRHRDTEFERGDADDRASLMARWEAGWVYLWKALDEIDPGELSRAITIRGESHSVMQAVHRQLAHYAQHVGQIVFLAKHLAGRSWRTLSIPRGKSREFEVARDGVVYLPGEKS
jgi:Protein of unknown function (DUF1572)